MDQFPPRIHQPTRPTTSAPFPDASSSAPTGPYGYADTLPPPPAPHVVPSGWGPAESVAAAWPTRLARWLGRLLAASILVFILFLVLVIAIFGSMEGSSPATHRDLGTFELVWLTAFGCAGLLSSFFGGMLATTRNQAEIAGLLGSAGVVALLGLTAHHITGGSQVVIPGALALLDFFVPLCLILVGAAFGNYLTHRTH